MNNRPISSSVLRASMRATLIVAALASTGAAFATAPVAAVDTAFVGKVSQGGRFEVEASKLAADKASAQDVKDFASNDVQDHDKVNAELKSIADAQGIALAPDLNAPLQKKLDALGKLSGAAFDKAYIGEMAKIHAKDEGIFAKEAKAGASADWKAFAAKTDAIVKSHIQALKIVNPKA